jgi:hypothetical protein
MYFRELNRQGKFATVLRLHRTIQWDQDIVAGVTEERINGKRAPVRSFVMAIDKKFKSGGYSMADAKCTMKDLARIKL